MPTTSPPQDLQRNQAPPPARLLSCCPLARWCLHRSLREGREDELLPSRASKCHCVRQNLANDAVILVHYDDWSGAVCKNKWVGILRCGHRGSFCDIRDIGCENKGRAVGLGELSVRHWVHGRLEVVEGGERETRMAIRC